MTEVQEMSIEETNKLRISLGLAPLKEDDGNKLEEKKLDFVHAPAVNIKDSIAKAKEEEKQNNEKTIRFIENELDNEKGFKFKEQSTDDFLAEVQRKSKLKAERENLKAIEEENNLDPMSYSSKDLTGLTIQHKPKQFDNLTPTILTLKDKDILKDDDEVLINVSMAEEEKAKRIVQGRKRGFYDDPVDSDEDEEAINMGFKSRNILAKYDETIDGVKHHSFQLQSKGNYNMQKLIADREQRQTLAKGEISLNDTEVRVASDYYSPDEILSKLKVKCRGQKIRFPKRKIRKEEGEVDDEATSPKSSEKPKSDADKSNEPAKVKHDEDEEDDDEEFGMVASTLINPPKSTVVNETVAKSMENWRRIKFEKKVFDINSYINKTELVENKTEDTGGSGVKFNNLQEYTKQLERILNEKRNKATKVTANKTEEKPIVKEELTTTTTTEKSPEIEENDEENDEEEQMDTGGWQPEEKLLADKSKKSPQKQKKKKGLTQGVAKKAIKLQDGILGDEINVGKSAFAAALYAQKKGYLDDRKKVPVVTNPKNDMLRAKHFYEEKQRYDEPSAIELKMSRRDRQAGPLVRFEDKRDFQPDVKLEYVDEYGQTQDPKEAFRTLSHRFHGKNPGKIKTEKRRTKIEQESNLTSLASQTSMVSRDKLYRRMKKDKRFCVTLTGKDKI